MKLVCDSCQARYSIGDDRVAGKVFKIRCKKCSHVMVIRGTTLEPPAEPPIDDAWYAVVDGEQAGPLPRAELVRRHAAGELDDDALVWREGMEEWASYGAVAELRGEATRVEPAPVAPAPASDLFGTRTDDVFGEVAVVTRRDAPVDEPVGADAPRLHGERNENSVLFTLGNLAKLASPQPRAGAASAGAAGAAGSEGSGLIDIRALASSFAPAAKAGQAIGTVDDLPTYGPVTFGEPIVLVPTARRATDRRLIYALVAAIAMLVMVAVVLVILSARDHGSAQAATAPVPPAVASSSTPPADRDDQVAAGAPTTTTSEAATPAPTTPTTTGEAPEPAPTSTPSTPSTATRATPPPASSSRASSRAATSRASSTRTTASTTRTTRTTPSLTVREPDNQCTAVSCAVDGYAGTCCEAFRPKTPTPGGRSTGARPENLDRAALSAGIATIRAQACGNRSAARGDVTVSVKVSAEGGVTAVKIKSSPDPALSSCVIAAVQRGTFAKTQRGGSFSYFWRF